MFGEYEVDLRYDLKGSTVGRTTKFPEGVAPDKTVALKDNNFIEENKGIMIEDDQREELLESLKKTSDFLGECKILDYSTLVGVINLEKRRTAMRLKMIDQDDPIVGLINSNPSRPPSRG